jgi:hypothetical protein
LERRARRLKMALFKLVVNALATCSSVERLCIFSKRKCTHPFICI